MKTYNKSDFHNPEQLTRQQVSAEHRLLLPEEVDGRFSCGSGIQAQCVGTPSDSGLHWIRAEFAACSNNTYRVPLATPLPDGTVLSSNECCFGDVPAKPRLYLAGGMTGYVDYNFPAFFKAATELEQQGYEVINPAAIDTDRGYTVERLKQLSPAEHQQFLKEAVKLDLDAIQTCQAIAMLPGWESSKGARAELALAQWLGLDVIYLKGEAPTEPPLPYNSDERAEWNNDCGKIDMGDYSSTSTAQYAPDDPKGAAGAKKAPMDLLPPDALLETAKAMGHGAAKYGRWNFIEAKVCAHTYVAAIGRHWAAYAGGEDTDEESGIHHLAHLAANAYILMTATKKGTLNDDRPNLSEL